MLNRSDEGSGFCLLLDTDAESEAFRFTPFSMMLAVGFLWMFFIRLVVLYQEFDSARSTDKESTYLISTLLYFDRSLHLRNICL